MGPLQGGNRLPRVLVAHPGTQHSRQTVLALQKAGLLQSYVTGFYYKKSPLLDKFLKCLPFGVGNKLERQLLRRWHAELDQHAVLSFPLLELIFVLTSRLRFTRRWSGKVLRWRNRRFDARVAALVRRTRPDAVICYDSCALNTFKACGETGSLAILDQTCPPLSMTLEILREEYLSQPSLTGGATLDVPGWLVEQCRLEALIANRVLVASEFVKDGLLANGVSAENIVMLRYGVDTVRFHPPTRRREDKFRVLYVGHLSRGKGVLYLLEAFAQLELDDAELILVGNLAIESELLVPYRGIFRHVPHVPHHEIPAIYRGADVFVFPSLFEGMPLVVLEAMASGLPVITSRNAASVVRDGIDGYIIPIRDVEALKGKIQLLYRDKALRESMGRKARQQAENFTWQTYRQTLVDILHDTLPTGHS